MEDATGQKRGKSIARERDLHEKENARAGIKGTAQRDPTGDRSLGGYQSERVQ